MAEPIEVLQGTLDLLILKTLALGPLHGWGISKRVRQMSNDVFQVHQGSMYPALYRLEDKGWIDSEWGESADGRRTKVYSLTASGRKAFAAERANWRTFAATVELVLAAD
ncbi:MAG TPA: PadR family transcriptional regulator [Gemmatimonadaceae bacterium]|nr:PadR family transcriptional regulator [Gemmatimonadaceae bacterium]